MFAKAGAGIAGLVLLIVIAFSLSGTIDQSERGVYLRNGAIVDVVEPGRYFKLPIIDSVRAIEVSQQSMRWDKPLEAYTQDQQAADIVLTVNYTVPSDPESIKRVYSEYGSVEGLQSRLLARIAPQQLKVVTGKFNAQRAIQDRGALNAQVYEAIVNSVKGQPVTITGVQLEDVSFSSAYEQNIEARMKAEVEVQTQAQEVLKEREKAKSAIAKAEGLAGSQVALAEADAKATILRGNAEATAIKARADALAANNNLVSLMAVEKWDGKLPASMPPNSAVPFINVPTPK